MGSFMMAVTVVSPLLVYMVIGALIRKCGIFSVDNFKSLNVMIFRVFIPLALFRDIYMADLGESVRPGIFAFVAITVIVIFGITWASVSRCVKNQADAATIIQGIYRSNYVLFGGSVAASLCDADGVALVAALAAVVVPLFNILAVILFEVKRGGDIKPAEVAVNILKNPLVDAGILGCIFSGFHIMIPEVIWQPIMKLAGSATPLALVTLGGMLSLGSIVSHRKYLVAATVGRLVAVPVVALSIAIMAGLRGDTLVAILAVFASPTAVASGPMAQSMGGNGMLAGEIVAATSVGSIVTIFAFVFTLLQLGFL